MFYSYQSEKTTTHTAARGPRKISFDGQPQAPEEQVPTTPVEEQVPTAPPAEQAVPISEPAVSEPTAPAGIIFPEPAGHTGPTETETVLAHELKRVNAEYANYRTRVQRDSAAVSGLAVKDTLEKLLPVLDDISAARKYGDLEEGPFASISTKLSAILGDLGLEILGEIGEEFNPEVHEALLRQPNDEIPEDHVAMILRDGYRVGDRLIRAAQVVVSAG